jgi:hypothetical protein
MRGKEAGLAATAALFAAELATIEIVACRSARRASLAGELVSGFLDGLAQRDVAGERVTADADGARGDVDVDPGDAGELADLSPDGIGAVVAGHPGDSNTASGHDRHRSDRAGRLDVALGPADAYATSASYRVW